MKQILLERDWKLTKSLGQNFLHDQNQIRKIVAAGELTNKDKVIEIGPGLGPLTEALIQQAGEVFAIEKDHRLFEFLQQRFSASNNLKLLHQDALEYLEQPLDWSEWKLIANLPYSVASPILVELAQAKGPPERMVATLQLEVAQRLSAEAGSEHFGLLSLLVQLCFEPHGWFKIPASCFFPEPDVDSACITLIRRANPLLPSDLHGAFSRIVKRSFSQRRKMAMKLLKQDWPEQLLAAAFEQLGFSPQARAEELSLQNFCDLTAIVASDKSV